MAEIALIDTTVRDGNQSLWGATGLTTAMILEIAPVMDRVGFAAIDFTTSTHMAVAVRYQRENPWERIRLVREAMPQTPLSFLTTGMRFISWEIADKELMELAFNLLVRAGMRRFAIMDPMNDTVAMTAMGRLGQKAGFETLVVGLTFTVSPIHDDVYYASRARALVEANLFDRVYLKDPGGLLTPERARTLVPAIKDAIGAVPLELHSHCTIGLAPFSYLVAAELGATSLHTAARPLALGTSQPPADRTIANLRDLGHRVDIDDAALLEMDTYFTSLAQAEGLTQGEAQEYDSSYFRHQMPGGMLGTMRRQLAEMNRLHLLPQVLEEVARVRAELGYPIMVTPLSQVVGTQAVMNIVNGGRYEKVPDEVIRYVIGRFGKSARPLDPNVEDRIRSSPRAKELAAEPGMPSLSELRRRIGSTIPDEEFLLRAVMPAEQVDAMLSAGPAKLGYNPTLKPVMDLLRGVTARRDIEHASFNGKGLRIELNSPARPSGRGQ